MRLSGLPQIVRCLRDWSQRVCNADEDATRTEADGGGIVSPLQFTFRSPGPIVLYCSMVTRFAVGWPVFESGSF